MTNADERDVTAGPFARLFQRHFSAYFWLLLSHSWLHMCTCTHNALQQRGGDRARYTSFQIAFSLGLFLFSFLFILKKHTDEWLSTEMTHELLPLQPDKEWSRNEGKVFVCLIKAGMLNCKCMSPSDERNQKSLKKPSELSEGLLTCSHQFAQHDDTGR